MLFQVSFGESRENVERLSKQLNRFAGDIRTMTNLMEQVRDEVAIPATRLNFDSGGKGMGWEPLSAATPFMPRRSDKQYGNKANEPLIVTGNLKRSAMAKTRWDIDATRGNLFVPTNTFASNTPYGLMQHEGGTSALTGGVVPGRPFYYFTDRDIKKAEEVITNWIWEHYGDSVGAGDRRTTVGMTVRI